MSHPVRDYLVSEGYQLSDSGEYWRTSARYRGGTSANSIAIHKRTGRFKDFVTDSPWASAEKLIDLITGKRVDFSSYEVPPEPVKMKVTKVYPPEILKRLLPQFDFFLGRGISKTTLLEFKAGMAHSGKLGRRICFPIYDRHGRIVGFAGRWFKEQTLGNTMKWKLLGYKLEWLFPTHLNDSLLREKREVIIVESVGDVLALWEAGIKNVMCVFGTSLGNKPLSYIIGIDPKKIIIATNNDTGDMQVGQRAAEKMKVKLDKHFDETDILIKLPTKKDFGDMTVPEILSWYDKI